MPMLKALKVMLPEVMQEVHPDNIGFLQRSYGIQRRGWVGPSCLYFCPELSYVLRNVWACMGLAYQELCSTVCLSPQLE
jgi:hypothetical protein